MDKSYFFERERTDAKQSGIGCPLKAEKQPEPQRATPPKENADKK